MSSKEKNPPLQEGEAEEVEIIDTEIIKEIIQFFEDLIKLRIVDEEKFKKIFYFSGLRGVLPGKLDNAWVVLINNVLTIILENKHERGEDYTFTDDKIGDLEGLLAVLEAGLSKCNVRNFIDSVLT